MISPEGKGAGQRILLSPPRPLLPSHALSRLPFPFTPLNLASTLLFFISHAAMAAAKQAAPSTSGRKSTRQAGADAAAILESSKSVEQMLGRCSIPTCRVNYIDGNLAASGSAAGEEAGARGMDLRRASGPFGQV